MLAKVPIILPKHPKSHAQMLAKVPKMPPPKYPKYIGLSLLDAALPRRVLCLCRVFRVDRVHRVHRVIHVVHVREKNKRREKIKNKYRTRATLSIIRSTHTHSRTRKGHKLKRITLRRSRAPRALEYIFLF
jgi:hypothetical protein